MIKEKYEYGGQAPNRSLFVGESNGPEDTLVLAQWMYNEKISDKDIKKDTGWQFSPVDGKWRYEISTKEFDFTDIGIELIRLIILDSYTHKDTSPTTFPIEDIFSIPDNLFFIKGALIGCDYSEIEKTSGYYDSEQDITYINSYNYGTEITDSRRLEEATKIEIRRTIIHELQHRYQGKEAGNMGTSPQKAIDSYKKRYGVEPDNDQLYDYYYTLLSEYEAELAATRLDLSQKEISESPIDYTDGLVTEFQKGGLVDGPRHSAGGVDGVIVPTEELINFEGGEVIITREASKKHCEVLSDINVDGGGDPIPCDQYDEIDEHVNSFEKGGKVSDDVANEIKDHAGTFEKVKAGEIDNVQDFAESLVEDHRKAETYEKGGLLENENEKTEVRSKENAQIEKRRSSTETKDSYSTKDMRGEEKEEIDPDIKKVSDDIDSILSSSPTIEHAIDEVATYAGRSKTGVFLSYLYSIGIFTTNPVVLNKYLSDRYAILYKAPEPVSEPEPTEFEKNRQLLDEFFTPDWVAKIMVDLAYEHGYNGKGPVLEPSFGQGVFFDELKKRGIDQRNFVGFEIYQPNFKKTHLRFPFAKLYNTYFEYLFLKEKDFKSIQKFGEVRRPLIVDKFKLIIGNPPYGDHTSPHAYYFDKWMQVRAEGFFLWLCGQMLDKEGVLVMILPSLWMHNGNKYNHQKQEIDKHMDLVDAYRLPNATFEKTDIATDILVFKHKKRDK